MRVLVVGSLPRVGAPNHLPWLRYTTSALARLGHTVWTSTYRESWAASPTVQRRLSGVPGAPAVRAAYIAAIAARRDRQLVALAKRVRPELTIVLKGEVYRPDVWPDLKCHARGPLVTWWVDNPLAYPESVKAFEAFDRVFLFDRSYVREIAARGIRGASFLPCACDETVYRPMTLSARDRRRLESDVAFVASYYPKRGTLARALAATMNVGVWGHGWSAPAAREELDGAPILRGGVVDDETATKIYNASAIGLNAHHPQTRDGGINTRTFELLAAGITPLIDRVRGLEDFLEPGREVVCYDSIDHARDLATELLADAGQRAQIVHRGRERVLAEHTYLERMRTLCRAAFE